jgi:hypothetical protein
MGDATLQIYKRGLFRKTWGWRLLHHNGDILATDGGQGYENRKDAVDIGYRVVTGGYNVQ